MHYLINIIQSEERYRDRFHFFLSLDNKVNRQIIYVQSFYSEVSKFKNTVVKTPPDNFQSGIKFWLWVFVDAFKLLRKRKEKWVIVEHLTGLVLVLFRLIQPFMRAKLVLVHGIYSEDFYYLKNKVWRKDAPHFLDKKQDQFYSWTWQKRVIKGNFYLRFCDAVITNSLRMLEWVPEYFSKPTFYIPNIFESKAVAKEKVEKDVDILFVGEITPAKGLISLFETLESIHQGLNTVVIGKIKDCDSQWADKVFERFSSLNITYIQHLKWSQLEKYYKKSRLFVFPSYSEGSARVILEALNLGCTVIASDIPGNKFLTNAKTSPIHYYEPGNQQALKEKILLQLKSKENCNIHNQNFLSQFEQDDIGNKLIKFYDNQVKK